MTVLEAFGLDQTLKRRQGSSSPRCRSQDFLRRVTHFMCDVRHVTHEMCDAMQELLTATLR